jgi:hypothetical protein
LNNEQTLLNQLQKTNDLSINTIPGLNTQIEQSEKLTQHLKKQLKDQQHQMEQLFNKAQNITSNYSGDDSFFDKPKNNVYPIVPTAPEYAPENPPTYQESEEHYQHSFK